VRLHTAALPRMRSEERSGARGQEPERTPLKWPSWMVCQYSRFRPLSSEKHGSAPDAGAQEGHGDVATTPQDRGVVGRDRALSESLAVITRMAKAANASRSRTCGRLYLEDTLLGRLSHKYYCPCSWLWSRRDHLEIVGCNQGDTPTGVAGDAVETRALEGFGQGHVGQDPRQASGQHHKVPTSRRRTVWSQGLYGVSLHRCLHPCGQPSQLTRSRMGMGSIGLRRGVLSTCVREVARR
jgi:hypothetical protein